MSLKRNAPDAVLESESHKKLCNALNVIADEFICPITLSLPLKPVLAEDGHVYECDAIKKYFVSEGVDTESVAGTIVQSPLTREPMGLKLVECLHIRNTIEKLIRLGLVNGDKADGWIKQIIDVDKFDLELKKANDDKIPVLHKLASIVRVGGYYVFGKGVTRNTATGLMYYKRGLQIAEDDMTLKGREYHACCLANIGIMYFFNFLGDDIPAHKIHGICLLTEAATMGMAHAAVLLGDLYSSNYGVPKDLSRAMIWYDCATKCNIISDGCDFKLLAAKRLQKMRESGGRY
jgi:hypothetical protein